MNSAAVNPRSPERRLMWAWLGLCLALAVHVLDETVTGFLGVYNPTMIALRARIPWWPMPTFTLGVWLGGLIALVAVLVAASPLVARGVTFMRWVAYLFAVIMILNAVGHTVGTVRGRTLDGITYAGAMPGFYSSGLLLAAGIYLLIQLRRTRP